MPITFHPNYQITQSILEKLYKIDQIKEQVKDMPLTPHVLAGLKETSRIITTHYSTVIEGNRLTEREVREVLKGQAIQGWERDEKEVKGYFRALDARQKQALALFEKNEFITAKDVEELFHFAGRTARQLLQKWVRQGFVAVADPSKKARKYKLNNSLKK